MKIGILGATGAVGQQMLKALDEREIVVEELRLFSSQRSAGKKLTFRGKQILVEEATESSFDGLDVVLGASDAAVSRQYAPWIKAANTLYIDNSSAFRLEEQVPLVIPEINPEDAFHHCGIIANPNCVTIIGLMACAPILRMTTVKKITVSSYQAVSGAGNKGIEELHRQMNAWDKGTLHPDVFSHPIAGNVIPCIGEINEFGITSEEMKFQNESRKILHDSHCKVSCTCVRVPVERSHSLSMMIECDKELSEAQLSAAYQQFSGVQLHKEVITPLQTAHQDDVHVCRLRHDLHDRRVILLWCSADQIRKGAAVNAVQILELVQKEKLSLSHKTN